MLPLKTTAWLAAFCFFGTALADPDFGTTKNAHGYRVAGPVKQTRTGFTFPLAFNDKGSGGVDLFGKTLKDLTVTVDYETEDRLHVLITDTPKTQYLVPDTVLGFERPTVHRRAQHPNYDFKYTQNPFGFQVIRKSDNEIVFDTVKQPFVFEDQYIELTSALPHNANVYGLGETTEPFRKDTNKNVTTIFTADEGTSLYRNSYGAHPMYLEHRKGQSHAVFLLSAHGMDVFTVDKRITYKIIGGGLDFYFFTPKLATPNNIVSLYTDLVGKPFMVSHWMMGWHQCRYGFSNISVVDDVVKKYKEANIPLETMWIDIDYMDHHKDFTLDPVNFPEDKVKALISNLHNNGQKIVTMVDPALSTNSSYEPYKRLSASGALIRNPDGSEYQGQVWPGYTVYPDWWHPDAAAFWDKEMGDWMERLDLDGIWIDMNEPSAFCIGSCGTGKQNTDPGLPWLLPQDQQDKLNAEQYAAVDAMAKHLNDTRDLLNPKYTINNVNGNLSVHAVSTIAQFHGNVSLYDIKNLYGHAMSHATRNAIQKHNPKIRPFVLTRSTFAGTGNRAGHWTGDNHSLWNYLKISISSTLTMQMFGISYSGADVCGFNGDTTEEMCTRWMQVGAFYPFARNHNAIGQIDQYPYLWESTAEASRIALGARYEMLPLFYTLHEESSRLGTGVWRPLLFEYPEVESYTKNDAQILLGTDVLLSPVVDQGKTSVQAQFPVGKWYDWFTYKEIDSKDAEKEVTIPANLTQIPIHIRGGAIVPTKTAKYTVDETYKTPYTLLVALDKNNAASGRLYVDDGNSVVQHGTSSIDFAFKNGKLRASGKFGYKHPEPLGTIKVIGGNAAKLTKLTIQGRHYKVSHPEANVAVVENLNIPLTKPFSASF
ncbi:alpha glucosidase [Gongronella butleri]|nr:alpha glucosidase [Gongronella butleri]